jgi:hypothetical protein
MLEHVMVATVTLDPAIPLKPGHDFVAVRFRLSHGAPDA